METGFINQLIGSDSVDMRMIVYQGTVGLHGTDQSTVLYGENMPGTQGILWRVSRYGKIIEEITGAVKSERVS